MTEKSVPLKLNIETYDELKRQFPDESFNEIIGWTIFELTYTKKQAQELKVSVKDIQEANFFISSISSLFDDRNKIRSFVEIMKDTMEKVNYKDAMIIFKEQIWVKWNQYG